MLVDSHCHLDLIAEREGYDIPGLVQAAHESGVKRLLSIGIDQANSERVVDIAARHEHVFATVGVHPCNANSQPVDIEWLREWAAKPKVIGLGETGLDYFHDPIHKDKQWQSFADHLTLSGELGLPVIVHTRNAKEDTLAILREYKDQGISGLLHCFTEDWGMAEEAIALGFYISISGIVTFKKAEQVHEAVKNIPLDRLLVETDSPYLAPVPYRGKTNQPAFVNYVAERCAELKGVSKEDVVAATGANFMSLFSRCV